MEEKRVEDYDYDEVDEFFGDGDAEHGSNNTNELAARELAALTARLTTLGYQDGVDDGVEESVQEGFDIGYAAGAAAGWEAGLLYGAAAATAAALAQAGATTRRIEDDNGRDPAAQSGEVVATVGVGERVENKTETSAAPRVDNSRQGDDQRGETAAADGQSTPVSSEEGRHELLLSQLADELRRASLLGPDAPQVNRGDALRRMRLAGSMAAVVAGRLE